MYTAQINQRWDPLSHKFYHIFQKKKSKRETSRTSVYSESRLLDHDSEKVLNRSHWDAVEIPQALGSVQTITRQPIKKGKQRLL